MLDIILTAVLDRPRMEVPNLSPIEIIRNFYQRNPQLEPISKLDISPIQLSTDEEISDITEAIPVIESISYKPTHQLMIPLPSGSYIETAPYGQWRGSYAHTGVDLAAPTGTIVLAADAGTVSYADWAGGYGYLIIIDHGNGRETYYSHLSAIGTQVGTQVPKGRGIGWVGSTGRSTGPHLHWEYRIYGEPVDPWNYVK